MFIKEYNPKEIKKQMKLAFLSRVDKSHYLDAIWELIHDMENGDADLFLNAKEKESILSALHWLSQSGLHTPAEEAESFFDNEFDNTIIIIKKIMRA